MCRAVAAALSSMIPSLSPMALRVVRAGLEAADVAGPAVPHGGMPRRGASGGGGAPGGGEEVNRRGPYGGGIVHVSFTGECGVPGVCACLTT